MLRLFFTLLIALVGCDCGSTPGPGTRPDASSPIIDDMFVCINAEAQACLDGIHYSCSADGEFLQPVQDDCGARDLVCVPDLWCVVCTPGSLRCNELTVELCLDDGSAWVPQEECDVAAGGACIDGGCKNLCEEAIANRSYVGCEFYAADLDNAVDPPFDASAQQYAIVVSNTSPVAAEVVVEVNDAPFGEAPMVRELEHVMIPAGDLEVFPLPRREVDGSSSNQICDPVARACTGTEVCLCSRDDTEPPCFCRVSAESNGANDGTHTAVSSQAFRVRSSHPVIAYQFNPLDNVNVFSNDASLLLPVSALGERYTVIGWPQTVTDDPSRPDVNRNTDFRSTLTILGTAENTDVTITLGPDPDLRIVGEGPIPDGMGPGGVIELSVDPFDVINIETGGHDADFTGTVVESTRPVAIFTGSEASDVPRFDSLATYQCCADHLEEQLFPDTSLGQRFLVGRMPPRGPALNRAFLDPTTDSVGEPNEPEWVRVLAVVPGATEITTTLPEPDDMVTLSERESVILRANQDFILEADQPVAVMSAIASQQAVGISNPYPGGDPALVLIPPVEQYRKDYVFLTPDLYAFDFVTITAAADTQILLDGLPLSDFECTTAAADGRERRPGDPPPTEVVYRCQLSFPDILGALIEEGIQYDGVHTINASEPVGIVVYGFDAYVSYAYAGGLDLEILR